MDSSSILTITAGVACGVSVASAGAAGIVDDDTNRGLRLKCNLQVLSSSAAAIGFVAIGGVALLSILADD